VTEQTPQRTGLKGFLRENWLFLVAPLVLILLALAALFIFGDDSPGGFFYNIF
jgi:hypothetical protein